MEYVERKDELWPAGVILASPALPSLTSMPLPCCLFPRPQVATVYRLQVGEFAVKGLQKQRIAAEWEALEDFKNIDY